VRYLFVSRALIHGCTAISSNGLRTTRMSMSCLTDELLSDGASRRNLRMLRTADEASAGDASARRKTCKFIRIISLSRSAESHARRASRAPRTAASLSVLLEMNGVPVGSAVGTPANDANYADWSRRVEPLTLEIISQGARQDVWVD
jgi:hypothetical protein